MILKLVPYLVLSMASLTGGFFVGSNRATKTAEAVMIPCPSCNCPPAAVIKLAPDFDVTKINNKRGEFHYEPKTEFQGDLTVVIDCQDSTLLKQILKQAK